MNINAKSDNNLVYNYEQKDGMMVAQTVYKARRRQFIELP